MTNFLLWKTNEDILKNIAVRTKLTFIVEYGQMYFYFCVTQNKESHVWNDMMVSK